MSLTRRQFAAFTAGTTLLAGRAHAQYPDKTITVLCAFPAGAGADASLRALAQAAGKHLGQSIVVDNRPGVAGTLAATTLLNARPDGYTLAQVTNTLVRQPFIARTPYDIAKDFSYVLGVTAFEFGLVVRADAPWKTLADFLAHAKASGNVTYGTSGIGTAQHQVMEQLAELRGIRWTHVPYKGTAPLLNDLQGGHLTAVSDTTGWGPFVDAGKFRALAVYGPQRLKRWPTVPTLKESGFDLAEAVPWGLVAPAGVPADATRKLHDAFRKGLEDPQFLATLNTLGQEVRYMNSDGYRKYMLDRIPVERAVVDRYNLKIQ